MMKGSRVDLDVLFESFKVYVEMWGQKAMKRAG
jgi:hypothetical protein